MTGRQQEKRREFLISGVRYLAFGGLGLFGAGQVMKGRRLGTNCIKLEICRDCIEYSGCSKPKAEDARTKYNPPERAGKQGK